MTPEMRARARLVYSFELWQDITGWDDEMLAQTLGKKKPGQKKRNVEWVIRSPIDWGYVAGHTGSYSDDTQTDAQCLLRLCQEFFH